MANFALNNSRMADNFTSDGGCFDRNSTATRVTRVAVYCVIILVSALGNTMTIMVVRRNKTMRKSFHCFIVNLAATDLIITLVYMPRVIVMWLRGSGCNLETFQSAR
ncbi:histamine H2 receptor-like [Stylophora pistillata]|uniref:histamine H2 receptor-like n=1 Tax=Stylophora pistillata TaxID=50429 RepID=UPI000C055D5B|nr:histamine H2 receptor-like [Stylophora pistillata]